MNETHATDLAVIEGYIYKNRQVLESKLEKGHLAHALATADNVPYVYTAGFTPHLGYELITIGAVPSCGTSLVAAVGALLRGKHVNDGEVIEGIGDRPLKLLTQSIRDQSGIRSMAPVLPLIFGIGLLPVQIRQVCWPDDNGHYPWESGFDKHYPQASEVLLQSMVNRLN